MQTFLPYPDFAQTFACLDSQRLGKQRAEALTILEILADPSGRKGWRRHPAVLMWGGYAPALKHYLRLNILEWLRRGFENNMAIPDSDIDNISWPWWLGREELHRTHRAALLRKDPAYYGRFGWKENPRLPYWWPTKNLQPLEELLPPA
jgi:hypothetical protein